MHDVRNSWSVWFVCLQDKAEVLAYVREIIAEQLGTDLESVRF